MSKGAASAAGQRASAALRMARTELLLKASLKTSHPWLSSIAQRPQQFSHQEEDGFHSLCKSLSSPLEIQKEIFNVFISLDSVNKMVTAVWVTFVIVPSP